MAFRNDVIVLWHLSPRIITIAAPSTEIVIQDLHDTLRDLEDEPSALIYPTIISTAGKEELGGGVLVGLTATLLDAQLAFEARTTEYNTGTATGGSSVLLEDTGTGTDFISDGALRGDIVENTADGSQASVLNVSTNQLTLTALTGGATNQFDPGDTYTMWHVIQCGVSGGNIVAVDPNGSQIDSIFTTAFTQVVRTSSSSATLQELGSIQFSSFSGHVTIDGVNGVDSLLFPAGTDQAPVKTLTFAKTIAASRGITRLEIISPTFTIANGEDISGFAIEGLTASATTITLAAGSITSKTEFFDITVTGDATGATFFTRCTINNLTDFEGTMTNCQFNGGVALLPNSGIATIIDSWSGIPGNNTPKLDMGGTGNQVAVRRYAGGLELMNYSGVLDSSIDIVSGHIKLAATITNGTFVIRGTSKLTDNSTGTASIDTKYLVFPFAAQLASFNEHVHMSVTGGIAGIKYPIGTPSNPVNNLADAKLILADIGLNKIELGDTLVVLPGENLDGVKVIGSAPATSVVVLTTGCSTAGAEFENLTLTGIMNGEFVARQCGIISLSNVGSDFLASAFIECQLLIDETTSALPSVSFKAGLTTPNNVSFLNCFSGGIGVTEAVIDFNGSAATGSFQNWVGGLVLDNHTGGQTSSADVDKAHITINASCTFGTLILRGMTSLDDNSTGTFVVNVDDVILESDIDDIVAKTSLIPGTL